MINNINYTIKIDLNESCELLMQYDADMFGVTLKKISDNDLKKVLRKLKLVNDMKIKISGDGTWEMKDFYVIIATAYFDYINCIDVTSKDVLFENIQNHIFSMF
jgi:hypothetical protein